MLHIASACLDMQTWCEKQNAPVRQTESFEMVKVGARRRCFKTKICDMNSRRSAYPPLNFHTNTLKRLLTKSHSVRVPQAYVHMCRGFFFRDMVSELSCVISSC